ncbi:hypothetical protein GOODEAATRI_003251 [Goodea atripinnis]|uniref:Uncharacterized protein n=1 Tax=Goodea atripinnis TaxID=208336 RepID=A0ABV0PVL6_9TELE
MIGFQAPSQQLRPLPRPFQTSTSHAHMTTFSKGVRSDLVAEALRPHRLGGMQRRCTKPSGKHSANRVLSERPLRDISSYGGRRVLILVDTTSKRKRWWWHGGCGMQRHRCKTPPGTLKMDLEDDTTILTTLKSFNTFISRPEHPQRPSEQDYAPIFCVL